VRTIGRVTKLLATAMIGAAARRTPVAPDASAATASN